MIRTALISNSTFSWLLFYGSSLAHNPNRCYRKIILADEHRARRMFMSGTESVANIFPTLERWGMKTVDNETPSGYSRPRSAS